MARAKQQELTLDEKLRQALVPEEEQPYKVPENWVWTKTGHVIEVIMGQSPNGEDTTDDPSFTGLIGGAADMGDLYPKVSRYTVKPTKLSKINDIIVSIRATLGRPIFSDGEYCLGRGVCSLRSYVIPSPFIRYFILSFEGFLCSAATGTTFPQVSKNDLEELPFPLPPLVEQQRIVDRIESLFAKLDQAKELAQNALDIFETRKAAILHKAFTGELTAKWREKNGVGMESWIECQLQDVCTINPKKADINGLTDNVSVTFVPMPAVSEVKGAIVEPISKPLGEVRKGYTNFIEGDVLFAKITPCMENGKSAVVGKLINNVGFGSTEFYVLRCSEKIYNYYLYHLVRDQSFRDKAKAVMTGAVGQQRVPKSFLEEYSLHLPTLPEQKEIVRILDSLFEKEQKAKELCDVIDKIDLMKKAILARAFRGELGTNDPSEESAVELLKECLK